MLKTHGVQKVEEPLVNHSFPKENEVCWHAKAHAVTHTQQTLKVLLGSRFVLVMEDDP